GVNISLVIDRSGSMSANNRMDKVKEAVKTFVNGLDDNTYLSIVSFGSSAKIDLSSTRVGANRNLIQTIVEKIYPSGSTNINDGLSLGYQELLKYHNGDINSRLLLLTDGMTNSGETNTEKIVQNSKQYNDKGIEISTIGVGQSLDFDLLRNLAETGRGSNHFIGDSETDIQNVFVDELESLLYQIGKNPEITITLPEGYAITKVYGYNPNHLSKNKISVSLENLNSVSTQILLLEVKKDGKNTGIIKTDLTFTKNGKQEHFSNEFKYSGRIKSTNKEIVKNYTIAYMADALKDYAALYSSNQSADTRLLREAIDFSNKNITTPDKDVERVYDILKGLEKNNPNNAISVKP
nr:VWA domain-containing protein [Flavobacteriales bacterium]